MSKYTIEFSKSQQKDSSFIAVPIVEVVALKHIHDEQIGISQDMNALFFCEDIDTEDEDIRDFLRLHFKDYKSVLGFMRRILGH